MSQWHREHPELYAQGYEPWDAIEAEAHRIRKEEPRRPCTHCGELTRGKWCSETCRRAEDGPAEEDRA